MMKYKHAALMSLLLSQTALAVPQFNYLGDFRMPAGGTPTARFRVTDDDRPGWQLHNTTLPLNIVRIDYEPRFNPRAAQDIAPFAPIANGRFGEAIQRIHMNILFENQEHPGEPYLNEQRRYPLRARWDVQSVPGIPQIVAQLIFSIRDEHNRDIDIQPDHPVPPRQLDYPLISQGPEVDQGIRYDGHQISRIRSRDQRRTDPQNHNQVRQFVVDSLSSEIEGHEGREVVFVQPFVGHDERIPAGGYIGRYRFRSDLAPAEHYPHLNTQSLVYSDGQNLFRPHVTQALWERENTNVRFLIASKKPEDRVFFLPDLDGREGARLDGALTFPQGLYQLLDVEENRRERLERWARVVADRRPGSIPGEVMTVRSHPGVPAIPGLGNGALGRLILPPAVQEVRDVYDGIQRFAERIEAHPGFGDEFRIIVMGPSGAGKSTFFHLLANGQPDGNARPVDERHLLRAMQAQNQNRVNYRFAPQQDMPDFPIGHRLGVVGTTEPKAWRQGRSAWWDTNGLGDARGAAQEILNAEILNKLAEGKVKILLMAPEATMLRENERGRPFVALIDQLVRSFPAGTRDWYASVCLLCSQSREYVDHKLLIRELLDGVPAGQNALLDDPSNRAFLEYLAENGHAGQRVGAFRTPAFWGLQAGGLYPADERQALLRTINRARFLQNPDFRLHMRNDVGAWAANHGHAINDYITHFFATHVTQGISNYFSQLIKTRPGNGDQLRQHLRVENARIDRELRNLDQRLARIDAHARDAQTRTKDVVKGVLNRIFNLDPHGRLRDNPWFNTMTAKLALKSVKWLAFLKNMNNDIRYDLDGWRAGFQNLARKLRPLEEDIRDYSFNQRTNELILAGHAPDATGVQRFVENNHTRSGIPGIPAGVRVRKVTLRALNTFRADGTITANEGLVTMIAPEIAQSVQSVTVNVNAPEPAGLGRAPDNQPGQPGRHGGNGGQIIVHASRFHDAYKAAHPQAATSFNLKRNGASGQWGQEGGHNTSTADPKEGNQGGWDPHGSEQVVEVGRGTSDPAKDYYIVSGNLYDGGTDDSCRGQLGPFYTAHLEIRYNVTKSRQAGIRGNPGAQGYPGGAGGLRGHDGLINVSCPHLNYVITDDATDIGQPGAGGNGGAGGAGGRVKEKTVYDYGWGRYYNENTKRWHQATADNGLTDRRREEEHYLDVRGESGPGGEQGVRGGNAAGQGRQAAQMTEAALRELKRQSLAAYAREYWRAAADPEKAQLVKVFPGLPIPAQDPVTQPRVRVAPLQPMIAAARPQTAPAQQNRARVDQPGAIAQQAAAQQQNLRPATAVQGTRPTQAQRPQAPAVPEGGNVAQRRALFEPIQNPQQDRPQHQRRHR